MMVEVVDVYNRIVARAKKFLRNFNLIIVRPNCIILGLITYKILQEFVKLAHMF